MELDDVRLLIRVVELGSVQGAAKVLGVSRSSLRRRIENLAADVGRPLLVSSANGIELTAAGRVVLAEGRALLEGYARMVSAAQATHGEPKGQLRLLIPVGMPEKARVQLTEALYQLAPGVVVEEAERPEPLDHLHEPFDVMFHFGDPPERGEWFSRVATRFRVVPVASAAYLEKHGRPTSIADLERHRLLSWQLGSSNPRRWPLWSGGSVAIEPSFISNNGQLLHRAAQEGLGVLLGTTSDLMTPAENELIPVLDSEIGQEFEIRWLSPRPTTADPRTRAMLETIQEFLKAIPPLT